MSICSFFQIPFNDPSANALSRSKLIVTVRLNHRFSLILQLFHGFGSISQWFQVGELKIVVNLVMLGLC